MADCTIKDNTYVSHDRHHVFLFSSEKLEKDKHLKLAMSHLSTDFTHTLNHYCIHTKTRYKYSYSVSCIYYIYIYLYKFL